MKKNLIKLLYRYISPHFRRGTYLFSNSSISIGSHTSINYPSNLDLGDNVFIGNFNNIDSSVYVRIGKFTQITNYVSILNHSSHKAVGILKENYGIHNKQIELIGQGKVHIGSFCFIGAYTCIMPGSVIGNGCVVKAYSYVNGNFPDNVLIGGNPAKIIREI